MFEEIVQLIKSAPESSLTSMPPACASKANVREESSNHRRALLMHIKIGTVLPCVRAAGHASREKQSTRAREFDQFMVLCSLLRVLIQEAAHFISVILVHVAVCQRYIHRFLDEESPASLPSTRPRVSFSSVVQRLKDDSKGLFGSVRKEHTFVAVLE